MVNQFEVINTFCITLINVPCILYSLLSRPTNAQYMHINNILYILSTSTCLNESASSSGCLNFALAKVTKLLKLLKLQLRNSSRLRYVHVKQCGVIKSIEC